MKEKKHLQNFKIRCLDANKNAFKAIITVWIENHTNPKICDIVNKEEYSFKGKHDIFYTQYKDEFGTIMENSSWKLSNSFYGLRVKAEEKEIKIKAEQLLGLELLSSIYMLAILNMIMM